MGTVTSEDPPFLTPSMLSGRKASEVVVIATPRDTLCTLIPGSCHHHSGANAQKASSQPLVCMHRADTLHSPCPRGSLPQLTAGQTPWPLSPCWGDPLGSSPQARALASAFQHVLWLGNTTPHPPQGATVSPLLLPALQMPLHFLCL